MGTFPLAVYTAEHGLSWNYPRGEIDFAALDACRKAFGRLPDFDAGEEGFEGVWCTPERVFALRCQSVKGWDFRGRDATYLAVTWVPREQAATTDFEALLRVPALREPTHMPPPFFEATADCPTAGAIPAPPTLPDFRQVGAVLAGLRPGDSATFRRGLRGGSVSVCVRRPAEAPRHAPSAGFPGASADAPACVPPPAVSLRRVKRCVQKVGLLSMAAKSVLTPTMTEKSHFLTSLASPSMSRGFVMRTLVAAQRVKQIVAQSEKMW